MMSVLCLSALESMISDVPSTWRIPSLSILCVIAGQYSLLSFQLKSSQLLGSLPFPPPNKTRLQPTSFPVLHSESGGIAYILLVFPFLSYQGPYLYNPGPRASTLCGPSRFNGISFLNVSKLF